MPKNNVEKQVISWLEGVLPSDCPVYGDQPKDRTEKYVLVDRTGGPREAMVLDKAEILIEVYHKKSRVVASDLASEIADKIPELLHTESITHASVNSVVKLDDTIAQYHRYQVYCDIYSRR